MPERSNVNKQQKQPSAKVHGNEFGHEANTCGQLGPTTQLRDPVIASVKNNREPSSNY